MEMKKTWFNMLCLFLFICGSAFTVITAIASLGDGQEYPYLIKGILLLVIAGSILAVVVISSIVARLQLGNLVVSHPKGVFALEWITAAIILVFSLAIRVIYVQNSPMEPQSDYKTYYEIAVLLNKGTLIEEGIGYCDYVAMFPHVIGYSYALSFVMNIFGTSLWVGQLFNIICAVATCFFVWRISVMLAGRGSGFIALIVTSFWPSQILYNNFLAAEYLFSCLLFMGLWLFLILMYKFNSETKSPGKAVFLHIVLGVLIAVTSAIRPMAQLLLIALLLCLIPSKMSLAIRQRNDLSIPLRILEKGWLRGLIIVISFFITSNFLTMYVSYTIDQDVASGSTSFGYNLLVGLNQQTDGGWNQEDADYLYAALERTGSASEAQAACRDLAIERIKTNPASLINLFLKKYSVLWSNDDYGSTWNLLFMGQQETLTTEREHFYYGMRDINNIWYLVTVVFSAIGAVYMIRKKANWACVPLTIYLGTVAMHLLVENQNRYHFHSLYIFVILTAVAINFIYNDSKDQIVLGQINKTYKEDYLNAQLMAAKRVEEADKYAIFKQQESMQNGFDMAKAIAEGHVKVSVSKAYEDEANIDNDNSEN